MSYENDASDINHKLGRIEGILSTITPLLQDHERRIRTSERKHWYFAGAATVVASLLNYLQPLTHILPK